MKRKQSSIISRLFEYDALANIYNGAMALIIVALCIIAISGLTYARSLSNIEIGIISARISLLIIASVLSTIIGYKLRSLSRSIRRKHAYTVERGLVYLMVTLTLLISVFYVLLISW